MGFFLIFALFEKFIFSVTGQLVFCIVWKEPWDTTVKIKQMSVSAIIYILLHNYSYLKCSTL